MPLRIGTRRSPLALAQAGEVRDRLAAAGFPAELVPMTTSGDRGVPAAQSREGMKGLFVQEIVRALIEGDVDLAVHSAKDLPSRDAEGVIVAAVPERASPYDVLISRERELAVGATVGSVSLRRQGQLRRLRPDLRVVALRGNVETRLAAIDEGTVDGVVLAAAGLARLGIAAAHARPLTPEEMLPAPGQGALAIQARTDDAATREALAELDHAPSRAAFEAERFIVAQLGGGCALPLGVFAQASVSSPGQLRVRGLVFDPDGDERVAAEATAGDGMEAAAEVAAALLAQGAGAILERLGR